MNRFAAAVNRLGGTVPEGESLKRMFAYWEAGTRAVTLPAYRRAFREIYETTDATLGFVPPDARGSCGRDDEPASGHHLGRRGSGRAVRVPD